MRLLINWSVVLCLSTPVLAAGPLTIVDDGEPRAVIVAAVGEPHALQGAREIQKYVERISGAKLDVLEEGQNEPKKGWIRIFVGHTTAAATQKVSIPSGYDATVRPDAFEEEGYVLKTLGNDLFIGGNSDGPYRGTLYGVSALLEKLGCRWYFPGEWGEIVPRRTTVIVPELNVESKPDFPLRYTSIGGWAVPTSGEDLERYDEWCTKIAFDTPARRLYPTVGDGFLGLLLPPEKYFDEHPEYYAMNEKGERWSGLSNGHKVNSGYFTMLCMSNPDVFRQCVQNIKDAFEGKHSSLRVAPNGFGVSPPDGSPPCHCEACQAVGLNFDYPNYAHRRMQMMSEEFFSFAAQLANEFPDRYVATMAYSLHEMPPQGVKLPPNVTVMQTPRFCCALHPNDHPSCWRRQEFMTMLRQWRRQTPHLYLYEYNPNFLDALYLPDRGTANAAANIPLYKACDIKGISAEGRTAFMETWITYYVTAKLLWDSTADVDAIKQEFYSNFFGAEAGPYVQAWWDACEQALFQARNHGHLAVQVLNSVYTVDFVNRNERFVTAALNCEVTDAQRERLEAFALIAGHLRACAEMQHAHQQLRFGDAEAAAERMLEHRRRLHEISPFFIAERQSDPPIRLFVRGLKQRYAELAAMTSGETGNFVSALPLVMQFKRDRYNEGVVGEWYADQFDDTDWGTKNTYLSWDQQDDPESEKGHDYDGYGWYRGSFHVPEHLQNRPVRFWCGGAVNEVWVWINGQYAGRESFKRGWWPTHDFDMDVTHLVQPGKDNTIAIRIFNEAELGGLYHRGLFWSPAGETSQQP